GACAGHAPCTLIPSAPASFARSRHPTTFRCARFFISVRPPKQDAESRGPAFTVRPRPFSRDAAASPKAFPGHVIGVLPTGTRDQPASFGIFFILPSGKERHHVPERFASPGGVEAFASASSEAARVLAPKADNGIPGRSHLADSEALPRLR